LVVDETSPLAFEAMGSGGGGRLVVIFVVIFIIIFIIIFIVLFIVVLADLTLVVVVVCHTGCARLRCLL
jgi:hypothetical protein